MDYFEDGTTAKGLVKAIDLTCDDLSFYVDTLIGRKTTYTDLETLNSCLHFARRDINNAIKQLEAQLP